MKYRYTPVCSTLLLYLITIVGPFSACSYSERDIATIATPTPSINSIEGNKYMELISRDGWFVPLPEGIRPGPKESFRPLSKSGKEVEAMSTTVLFEGEYLFRRGAMNDEQKRYLGEHEMKLVALKELKVGSNVYAYVILAEKVKSKTDVSGSGPHQHPAFYKIIDKDGDGKFETLYPGDSDNLVPDWALQK